MIRSVEAERARKQMEESLTWGERIISPIAGLFYEEPKLVPPPIEKRKIPGRTVIKSPGAKVESSVVKELQQSITKLNETVLGLSKNMEKTTRPGPFKEPGLGNPWDSSDALINNAAGALLGLED